MQPPLWPSLGLQVILFALTGFFAAAELSIPALEEEQLRRQAEEGDRKAAQLLRLAAHPIRTRTTIQLCVTLCGFFSAAWAALAFGLPLGRWAAACWALEGGSARAVRVLAAAAVTLAVALIALAFGYIIPRRISLHRREGTARLTCGPVAALSVLLLPLTALLEGISGLTLRLLHLDPHPDRTPVSEAGIRKLVDIGEEKGAIESDEKEMIENIFEFNNMTAADVMVHRTDMVMLWVDDPPEEIEQTIERSGLSRFPVYEEDADDVIGILNTREWLLNARKQTPKPLRQLLRPAYFVPDSVRTDALFRDMQSKKIHLSIVVDEYGGTAGLVTMEDLLEEIVGNIYDEFDPQEDQEIIPLGNGRWRIAGSAELEEIGAALDVAFPEDEDSETLGGLVFAQLSVIPEDGSHPEVEVYGLHIRVEELTDRRVEWATVTRTAPAPEEEPAPA
ncbi:hemolysin family protein [uncultured Flavonifractor sp.]|uniref:hemolysin family protein n=1 Tax=uncultured Flavonifractor sp. TaxID=1193534 RepID=UPI002620849F|nr:hemolysin family protein [uncultured Flavonifractor sp.]